MVDNAAAAAADDDDATWRRGLLVRSGFVLTLSTNISITKRPMTANATYDVISFRMALGAARTAQKHSIIAQQSNNQYIGF